MEDDQRLNTLEQTKKPKNHSTIMGIVYGNARQQIAYVAEVHTLVSMFADVLKPVKSRQFTGNTKMSEISNNRRKLYQTQILHINHQYFDC